MIRHWNRLLRAEHDPRARRRMRRSQTINAVGFCFTAVVLVIVLITKFLAGAWIAILAMAIIFFDHDGDPAGTTTGSPGRSPPTRTTWCCPAGSTPSCWSPSCTCRRCGRWPTPGPPGPTCSRRSPSTSTPTTPRDLAREWEDRQIPVALKVIDSPFREITKPVLDYVRRARKDSPRDIVTVFIPEYVVGPLVGTPAAQPVRAATQGPAAVHPRGDGHLRALATLLLRSAGRTDPSARRALAATDPRAHRAIPGHCSSTTGAVPVAAVHDGE